MAQSRLQENSPFIHEGCEITNSDFGRYVEIGARSRVANSYLGDYSYCDRTCDIANAQIGKFANIASFTRIGPTDHPLEKASMHHFLYRSQDYWDDASVDEAWFAHRASRVVTIGHDTWIGHNAVIRPEVTIGHGAVVASSAVVTKDVAPYTIVGGVTAEVIRPRFAPKVAEAMMELAWWDWGHDRLRAALQDFRDLQAQAFIEKYA